MSSPTSPNPLDYPGIPLNRTGVLTDTEFLAGDLDFAALTERTPVAAVGSNAAADTLRRKLRQTAMVVPIQLVTARDLTAGVSAHVSRPGYVPATPVPAPGRTARLVVTWLDPDQLAALDATEPNYRRVRLPAGRLVAESGEPVPGWMYASRHGWLVDPAGDPRPLVAQPLVLRTLLVESPALRELAGKTPAAFVETMRRADARERARELFVRENRVRGATWACPPAANARPGSPAVRAASGPAPAS